MSEIILAKENLPPFLRWKIGRLHNSRVRYVRTYDSSCHSVWAREVQTKCFCTVDPADVPNCRCEWDTFESWRADPRNQTEFDHFFSASTSSPTILRHKCFPTNKTGTYSRCCEVHTADFRVEQTWADCQNLWPVVFAIFHALNYADRCVERAAVEIESCVEVFSCCILWSWYRFGRNASGPHCSVTNLPTLHRDINHQIIH